MAALHSISKGRLRMQLNDIAGNAVAVYPAFRRVLGLSASTAQFLSQAVYWAERTEDGWFYKTESEWEAEIGLTYSEVRSARRALVDISLLEEARKGVPAKMHYRVNTELLIDYLSGLKAITSCGSQQELVVAKKKDKRCVKATTITKNTQETTAKTTSLALQLADASQQPSKQDQDEKRQEQCREIWRAYSGAYELRYKTRPVRNAKVNKQVVDLWKRLGSEAAEVAAYFVTINDSYLIRNCHEFGSLLVKAEAFRTQWATGSQMNSTTARQLENTQANKNAAQQASDKILRGEEGGNAFL